MTYFPLALYTSLLASLDKEIFRSEGSMFQMSLAYSLIVRSLENFPEAAMFLSTIMFQAFGFCKQHRHVWPDCPSSFPTNIRPSTSRHVSWRLTRVNCNESYILFFFKVFIFYCYSISYILLFQSGELNRAACASLLL